MLWVNVKLNEIEFYDAIVKLLEDIMSILKSYKEVLNESIVFNKHSVPIPS
jgi:hypothetical protein